MPPTSLSPHCPGRALAGAGALAVVLACAAGHPPQVEQILPRGAIAAVFEPVFVPASEAGIPDDAWVLGAVVDGRAHAYDLNLLNRHEVVNDRIAGRPIAAVW